MIHICSSKFKATCKIVMLSCPAFGYSALNVSCGADRASPPRHHRPRNRAEIPIGTGDSAATDGPEAADFPPGALPNQRSATCHARSRGTDPRACASFALFIFCLSKREISKMRPPPPTVRSHGHSRHRALWIIGSGGVGFLLLFSLQKRSIFFLSTSSVQLTKSVGIGNRSRDVSSVGIQA